MIALIFTALAAGSAILSGIETALFSLQPFHVDRLKKRHGSFGTHLERLMRNRRRLLSAILFADSLVNLSLILVGMYFLTEVAGLTWPLWGVALVLFAVIVVVCDLIPKVFALADTDRFARLGVRVMTALMPLCEPVTRNLQRLSDRLADALTPRAFAPIPFLSEDELETLVELSAEEGALQETESEMIQEIIKLGDKTARDCMTPRVDTFSATDDLKNEELIPLLQERRYRRVPIYGETPDDILGVLDVQGFLLDRSSHYTEHLTPPSYVAETMMALDLLRSFLRHPVQIAIVVDEHGGFEGVVTLADLVEEIISDAVPAGARELYLESAGNERWLASGSARLDDINEALGLALEEEGIDTIGGLIHNRLGALPRTGAQLEFGPLRVAIRRVSRHRIEELLVERIPDHSTRVGDSNRQEDGPS